ncbi:acetyl-CoA synthase subunit gamma [Candidatus Poribacteria bacterium]|nr:acetyl-CoA synthase subunit gamma [Candidatus Poribacteria bacterium]
MKQTTAKESVGRPPEGQQPEPPLEDKPTCGCGQSPSKTKAAVHNDAPRIEGVIRTEAGTVPRVKTELDLIDHLGAWRARWGIRRMSYSVQPGLYAVGNPTPQSLVLVSANYKLSFDRLRSNLSGRDAWIMALDTKGINVWCAAGKGTFGTDEIVHRLETVGLKDTVSHRKLVLPQLAAPGVSAHEVKRRTGFSVVYGPVRAEDLPAFLDAGMRATAETRLIRFTLYDRLVLIPVELTNWLLYVAIIAAAMFILSGVGPGIFSFGRVVDAGPLTVSLFLGAFLTGTVAVPILLPYLPGRSFSLKGASAGLLFVSAMQLYAWQHGGLFDGRLSVAAWFLLAPAVASFVGMNFTGSSTYTSLSGVLREMRVAVPIQTVCAVLGLGLWLVGRFI